MAKKVIAHLKLHVPGGKATPAPPVGPILAQHGLNISEFCKKFNDATQDREGSLVPVEIIVYEDKTYDFKVKQALTSELLKKAAGIEKASGKQKETKAGKITRAQLRDIAKKKMPDFNTEDITAAMKIVEGTAKSMGIEIEK
jgi:large subunit ribosomal protein L11